MTSRERLLAILRGEIPDRVGNTLRGVRAWDEKRCAALHGSYRPLVAATYKRGDWIAPIGFDGGFYGSVAPLERRTWTEQSAGHETQELRITEVTVPAGRVGPSRVLREVIAFDRVQQLPMTAEHFIKTQEDAEGFLSLPYAPARPDIGGALELDRRIGDRGLIMIGFSDGTGEVHSLVGTELLALWSVEHRELLHRLLSEQLRRKMDVVKHFISSGLTKQVTAIFGYTGPEVVVPPLHAPSDFHDLCFRYDRQLNELIRSAGAFVHVHCHASINKVLEGFVAMGTDMLHPVESPPMGDTPLAEAKRRVGSQLTIEGNVQISDVMEEEPAAFRRRVEQVVAEGKAGGRFCLCPTASPYAVELSPGALANYLTMMDVAETDGRY